MSEVAARFEHGRANPGYVKLELFCRGLRLAPDCVLPGEDATRQVRAGLGSGLELVLGGAGGMAVNAPVVEPFAATSPYTLHGPVANGPAANGPAADGAYELRYEGQPVLPVALPPRPAFYDRLTSSGKPMGTVGSIQGSYLGVYFGELCANWKQPDADACRFCGLGCSVASGQERTDKSIADVVETASAARAELGITFVHVNGGFDDRDRYLERFMPLMRALREETGLLLGLQIPPLPDPAGYHELARAGVDNISLCFEAWDEAAFTELCPGKARRAGYDGYMEAIRTCVQDVGFATTNGELIAGVEDPASTLAAVDGLTSLGAVPTVCVFRPLAGTALEDGAPPAMEAVAPVFAHLYRRCMERGLPIGVAPGLQVSIVMTPDEGRWLLPPSQRDGWRWKRIKYAAMRHAYGWHIARRARRAAVGEAR